MIIDFQFRRAGALTLRSSVAIAALAFSNAAFATDETAGAADEAAEYSGFADSGDAIVVTARRREESSQDVPIALSVVGAQTLERTGNFTLNQVQQLVPSLQVTSTNPRNSNVNIRGLGANSTIAVDGLEYGVGFYVDGVYYGRPGQSQFDLVDLQQIEILRGPQGTLFGKNTTAGALNITTREPSFDPELTVEGSIGDYHYHQIRASGSVPIIAEQVALRLSVADTHRDGFLTNQFTGKDAQDYDNFTARGQLLIKPSDDVKIRLIGDYSRQKLAIILNVIDGYFTKYANGATISNNIFDRAARVGYALPDQNAFARLGNSNSPYGAKMESYGASGQVDWDLGRATLTSVTAYRWWDWYPSNDVDGTPASINLKGQQQNFQRQFSQELRIASSGENKIDYVTGLFYFFQKLPGFGQNQYGADFAEWTYNPATVPATNIALFDTALSGLETGSYSNARTKSYAAFGQADWHITDSLTLTAGLRYTHENKQGVFRRFLVSGGDRSLLTPTQQAQLAVSDLEFSAATEEDAVTGLVTLAYKIAPEVLVYGTYSRGNKSGGLNITAGGVTQPVVDPEQVNAFEIGFKSQFFDSRLTFNAAAFLTDIKDYQTNVTEPVIVNNVPTGATIQYIANIPKVRSKGIEADLTFAPTRWLNLTASGAYTDAKFVSFANSPQAVENTNLPNSQAAIQDLSGKRLPGVSKFAYSLGADVSQPVNDHLEVYGRADWVHRSGFNAAATLSAYGAIPAYGILNARLGLRAADGRIDVSVWARNLLDKEYYISRSGSAFGLVNGTPGDPRTAGATLRVKW
jgi:iron complex outermembrane receptor protein